MASEICTFYLPLNKQVWLLTDTKIFAHSMSFVECKPFNGNWWLCSFIVSREGVQDCLKPWRTNLINIAVALGQYSKHHNDNSIIPNLALFSYIDRHSVLWSFGDLGHWSMMVMFITFTLLLNFIFLSFYLSCLLWISSLSHISNIFFQFWWVYCWDLSVFLSIIYVTSYFVFLGSLGIELSASYYICF